MNDPAYWRARVCIETAMRRGLRSKLALRADLAWRTEDLDTLIEICGKASKTACIDWRDLLNDLRRDMEELKAAELRR